MMKILNPTQSEEESAHRVFHTELRSLLDRRFHEGLDVRFDLTSLCRMQREGLQNLPILLNMLTLLRADHDGNADPDNAVGDIGYADRCNNHRRKKHSAPYVVDYHLSMIQYGSDAAAADVSIAQLYLKRRGHSQ